MQKPMKPTVAVLDLDDATEVFEKTLTKAGYDVEKVGVKTAELYNHAPSVFVINLSLKGAKKLLQRAKSLGSKIVITADIFETEKISDAMDRGKIDSYFIQGPGAARELTSLVRKAAKG
jgi:DNA-binding NtrC family response regulator